MTAQPQQPRPRPKISMAKGWKRALTIFDTETPRVKKHATLIGEVIWAWNHLHLSLASAFRMVLGYDLGELPYHLWAAAKNDATQRDMLEAAVRYVEFKNKKTRARLLWAIAMADKLAVYRNDAVHTALLSAPGMSVVIPVSVGIPSNRWVRMNSVNMVKLLGALRGDLIELSHYVGNTLSKNGVGLPLPGALKRPKLRTLVLYRESESQSFARSTKGPGRPHYSVVR